MVRRSPTKRRRNSLMLRRTRSGGVGFRTRSDAVVTVRKACASMARTVQRCQEIQVRTWCWSSPTRVLAAWKDSSMRQRCSGDRDQRGKGLGVGAVAAVVGQFAGGVVAADQQPVVTGLVGVFGAQVDPGPGVPALAFAAGAGGADLPRPRRYRSGEDLDAGGSGVDRDAPVRGDLHHVSQSQRAEGAPQLGVGAVHLIAGDPPRRGTPADGARDHLASQRGLGRERDFGRDLRARATLRVAGPPGGQVQRPVDERVPGRGGVRQIHRDLRVLDPAGGAGVLPLHPDRRGALLQVPGLIDHQHRVRVTQVVHDIAAQIVPDLLGIPLRPRQQVLQRIRGE